MELLMAASTAKAREAFPSVERLLGGRNVLRANALTPLDWIELIRQGIPAAAVDSVLTAIRVSRSDLAKLLGIPERTLARRRREGTLNSEESSKLLRVARVVGRATEVFEDAEAALDWLKAPNSALQRKRPLSLLDTDIGAESVLETLGRIEHGIFA
jgi:putative toxin-antitoxin system antitoxin component (TIGR02293 family)